MLGGNPNIDAHIKLTPAELAVKSRKASIRKERVIVRVYDPNRKQKSGDIFRARNAHSGPTGQMVLYDEKPQYIYAMVLAALKDINFQKFIERTDPSNGNKTKHSVQSPAFGIEKLPHLTQGELDELARKQELAGVHSEEV